MSSHSFHRKGKLMIKRLRIYFKEMYPIIPRFLLGLLLFFEIQLLVILTNGNGAITIKTGAAEIVGGITIFSFLMVLRIADDFKDFETDSILFPERPLPSGRVHKKDLATVLAIVIPTNVILNLIFLPNTLFFLLLVAYGFFMSFWFFQKYKIQKNLLLALVTHNPIQLVMNAYVISFACAKYNIPLLTVNNILILFTLYFPGLVWEITRKIRAPQDETEYITYSKLFGHKKSVVFVLCVMAVDLATTSALIWQLYHWAIISVIILYVWLLIQCVMFMKNPARFRLVNRFEVYEYFAEGSVVFFVAARLLGWWC